MDNQLVKISESKRDRVNPIPAIIFWVGATILAIAFFSYLSSNTNRALREQDKEHQKTLTELEESITRLQQSLEEITKETPQQKKETSKVTPYGNCPLSAQTYQNRYMRTSNMSDFICLDKALKRELGVR